MCKEIDRNILSLVDKANQVDKSQFEINALVY